MANFNCKWESHCFAPTETIRAVIRRRNSDGMTSKMLDNLVDLFNKRNGNNVPRPGSTCEIPIFTGFIGTKTTDLHR